MVTTFDGLFFMVKKMHGIITIFHDYNFLIMNFHGSCPRILRCNNTQILHLQGLSSSQQRLFKRAFKLET
jgi:hypothetical protein